MPCPFPDCDDQILKKGLSRNNFTFILSNPFTVKKSTEFIILFSEITLWKHILSYLGHQKHNQCAYVSAFSSFSRFSLSLPVIFKVKNNRKVKLFLHRHINTKHTRREIFKCAVCNRIFARLDNFQRHLRIHARPSNSWEDLPVPT